MKNIKNSQSVKGKASKVGNPNDTHGVKGESGKNPKRVKSPAPRTRLEERILYEDNHLIAVNKLPGELVQGDKTGDEPLVEMVQAYLKKIHEKPGNVFLGVVHRLDRPTSGVVLFAKTSKALARLNDLLKEREIRKIYWAVTDKPTPSDSGRLVHSLVRNQKTNKSAAFTEKKKNGKEGILEYRLAAATDRYFLLEIDLLTGRHHQIRAQLAAVGCRIKGDLKYGFPRSNPDGGIHLHARTISFKHPVSKSPVTISADPPVNDPLWREIISRSC